MPRFALWVDKEMASFPGHFSQLATGKLGENMLSQYDFISAPLRRFSNGKISALYLFSMHSATVITARR
jgi:hypothetical protein